jgi:hypothetical protein
VENAISLEQKREKNGCNAVHFWRHYLRQVCPSIRFCVRAEKLDRHRTNLRENRCSGLLIKFVGTVKFWIKSDYSKRRFTLKPMHLYENFG